MRENILKKVRLSFVSRIEYLDTELLQSKEEGKDWSFLEDEIDSSKKEKDLEKAEAMAVKLYEKIQQIPTSSDFPYKEPESIEEICALFPKDQKRAPEESKLESKILGAWVGRAAGCLLGQPVECWIKDRILGLLKDTDNYPIKRYISSDVPKELREKYEIKDEPGAYGNEKISWINNIECAPEDDDMNYTVMGLSIVEQYGRDFTPMDVAEFFTTNIPVFMTCTAERMAYKNIINGILPPYTASFGNPYREWLGAQIRVDGYAYINPGNAYEAAVMAVKDASVTHTKNGIYASAFCAALVAESAVCENAREAIDKAMKYIPSTSRLYASLCEFLELCDQKKDSLELIAYIHEKYDETNLHEWCHVIPNDMIICLALLYGGTDFTKVIGLAVEAGFDTDCNGATVGSVFGMMYGINAIPDLWTAPMKGELITSIGNKGKVSFQDLMVRCRKQI